MIPNVTLDSHTATSLQCCTDDIGHRQEQMACVLVPGGLYILYLRQWLFAFLCVPVEQARDD